MAFSRVNFAYTFIIIIIIIIVSGAICSHWSLQSRNSQKAPAKFRVVQTAFAFLSVVLIDNSR